MKIGWVFSSSFPEILLSFPFCPSGPAFILPWELKTGGGKGTDFKSCQGKLFCLSESKAEGFFLPFRKVWGSNGFEGLWIWLFTSAKIIISLNEFLIPRKIIPIKHWLKTSYSKSLQISLPFPPHYLLYLLVMGLSALLRNCRGNPGTSPFLCRRCERDGKLRL